MKRITVAILTSGGLLLLLLLLVGRAAPTTSQTDDADFETLAGRIGRAEAWYILYGEGTATTPGAPPAPVVATNYPAITVSPTLTHTAHLPLVLGGGETITTMIERRAIWITRYDWTTLGNAPTPRGIDAIVANVAGAGFNTILFQVRGYGDAYYTPGLEPWASRLTSGPISTTLGVDPGWDPLARMIEQGHAAGLEVHAYINVYTAWLAPPTSTWGTLWPPATTPPQMFDTFTYGPNYAAHPGIHGLAYDWRQHDTTGKPMPLDWNTYLWASPGLDQVADHVTAVVTDVVSRYAVDGVHLDLVRYAGRDYSYDPISNAAAGDVKTDARDQWQRDRVTALVHRVLTETRALRPEATVSAAVWPYYRDLWNWGLSEGYHDFYQDSKGWLAEGAVDAILPMLYGGQADEAAKWETLMEDFVASSGESGGAVYPGIGGGYDNFAAIAARIEAARQAGAPGHALFSYRALDDRGYWDDFTAGPYRIPARPDALTDPVHCPSTTSWVRCNSIAPHR